jgi:hypothetical protein
MVRIERLFSRRSRLMRSVAVAMFAGISFAGAARAADKVDFEKDVKPIFKESCVKCHSLDNPKHKAASGLRLDTKEDAMKGGKSGKAIIPGNAKDSVLYKILLGTVTVDGEDIDAMPKPKKGEHFKPLPDKEIEVIKNWIDQGADWPG